MIERTTDPMSEQTRAAIQRFHEAFNTHDIDALAGCITDDCLFEDTTPPDGGRHVGQAAVLGALSASSPNRPTRTSTSRI